MTWNRHTYSTERGVTDWKAIDTYTPKRGKHYIFWQPETINGRTKLSARIVSDDCPAGPRNTTHWAEIVPPNEPTK